jgi:hypothetical protein
MKVNGREVSVDMATDEAGDAPSEPARLELQASGPGQLSFQIISSPTDEFVRVGEALSLALPALLLWETLYPSTPTPDDARLEQLTATVEIHFHHNASKIGSQQLAAKSFTSSLYGLYGNTSQFFIPSRTDTLSFAITIEDARNATAVVKLQEDQVAPINVFGGDLPNKTLLFDNLLGGVLRHRVIEGGSLSAGAKVLFGYTDWRADQIVDKTNINTQIGLSRRSGSADSPVVGTLVHEVSYGVQFNDTESWRPEAPFTPNTTSLLGANRTDFEVTLTIPSGVTEMQVYAHVKTYLIADYEGHPDVTVKSYTDHEKVLVRDKYDTPHGPHTNYTFPIQERGGT